MSDFILIHFLGLNSFFFYKKGTMRHVVMVMVTKEEVVHMLNIMLSYNKSSFLKESLPLITCFCPENEVKGFFQGNKVHK